ncbi:MAG: hypothetical protein WBM14_18065 [Terracidiphilus sp.]|jgi:hypothetical protein
MRSLTVLLTAMLTIPISAAPRHAAGVTFYSDGNVITTGAPYANHAAFLGWLFDGKKPIGFIQPKHFLTLHLSPGPHKFSASLSTKHPAENSQLPIDLAEGGMYFIRVQEESRGALFMGSEKGRLNLVTCEVAHQEAANARPTDSKRIVPEMRDKVTSATLIPSCE